MFASEVELVQLPVSAEDEVGRPVTDLAATDWVVKENGRVQHLDLCLRGAAFGVGDIEKILRIHDLRLRDPASQYVLSFVSNHPAHDGRLRKLEVAVRRAGVKLRFPESDVSAAGSAPSN